MSHNVHIPPHMKQPPPPLPGLTSAVRGQWQSIGNAGVICQVMAWALCRFAAEMNGRSYGLIVSLVGICAFLAEFYGRLRWRKKQLPFPKWYSLCRYIGFLAVTAAVFVQRQLEDGPTAILLLGGGLLAVWTSLILEKHQRRRLREQWEMEET